MIEYVIQQNSSKQWLKDGPEVEWVPPGSEFAVRFESMVDAITRASKLGINNYTALPVEATGQEAELV